MLKKIVAGLLAALGLVLIFYLVVLFSAWI